MSPRSPEQFAEIREERRKQILEAALHVFAEESYHSASMASVATRAKVSKGLIYNYFNSKEEVLMTLVTDMFDEAITLMDLDMTKPLTKEKFISLIERSLDVVIENPQRWKLYMSLSFQPDVTPLLMEHMMPKVQPYMLLMSNYFTEKGHEDPVTMMRYYSAVVDGIQLHLLMDPTNFPIEKVKRLLIEQFA
jgi:AcrR family transcriptional regulator